MNGQSATSWQPPTDPPVVRRPSRTGLIVLVVAGLAIVGVLVLTVPGRDDAAPAIDTELALDGLVAIVGDDEDDFVFDEPDDCPLGDIDALVETAEATLELDDPIRDPGGGTNTVLVAPPNRYVICAFGDSDDDDPELTFVATPDPDGRELRSIRTSTEGDITRGPGSEHRGGTIESFCAEPDEGLPSCFAGWSSGGLLLFLQVTADGVEVEPTIEALQAVLDPMIAALEDEA